MHPQPQLYHSRAPLRAARTLRAPRGALTRAEHVHTITIKAFARHRRRYSGTTARPPGPAAGGLPFDPLPPAAPAAAAAAAAAASATAAAAALAASVAVPAIAAAGSGGSTAVAAAAGCGGVGIGGVDGCGGPSAEAGVSVEIVSGASAAAAASAAATAAGATCATAGATTDAAVGAALDRAGAQVETGWETAGRPAGTIGGRTREAAADLTPPAASAEVSAGCVAVVVGAAAAACGGCSVDGGCCRAAGMADGATVEGVAVLEDGATTVLTTVGATVGTAPDGTMAEAVMGAARCGAVLTPRLPGTSVWVDCATRGAATLTTPSVVPSSRTRLAPAGARGGAALTSIGPLIGAPSSPCGGGCG